MLSSRYISNPTGIFRIETNGVSVNTANVVFKTNSMNTNLANTFSGLILLRFDQSIPSGTTDTLPIYINGQAVTTYNDTVLTVANFGGTGIYLAYYDANKKTLQIV